MQVLREGSPRQAEKLRAKALMQALFGMFGEKRGANVGLEQDN